MPFYAFQLVNVFAESTLGGNPLCVFEDARGLDNATMQALALQFNLSETAFVFPSAQADAQVLIYTPNYELPFAGHPALGAAHVVRGLKNAGNALTLEFKAGFVPVTAVDDYWTFVAPASGTPRTARPAASRADIAAALSLDVKDLEREPLWVNTGAEQLMVPVKTSDAVRRAWPDSSRINAWSEDSRRRRNAYVFAFTGEKQNGRDVAAARFFFSKHGGGMDEDPGTGSACANLGSWLLAQGKTLPASIIVRQGEQTGRPCTLYLGVSNEGEIKVGGRVVSLGRGVITLPGM